MLGKQADLARVAVAAGADSEQCRATAEALARDLSLPMVGLDTSGSGQFDLLLVIDARRLELREIGRSGCGPIFVDFLGGPLGFRRRASRDRRQPLALAVGLHRGLRTVLDATAGLARDTFLLAGLGCTVVAVERSAVLGALVRDGLRRAAAVDDPDLRAVLDRMRFVIGDAHEVLTGLSPAEVPEVVYLDPMYPPKRKATLAKKELRMCRCLVGDDLDAAELLEVARRVAHHRVVVKRHHRAPPLAPRPTIQHLGKQVRYDVYHRQPD